jgi:hypothetical protein
VTGAEFRGVDVNLLADYIGGALDGTPDESVVATLVADDPAWRAAYETMSDGMSAVQAELTRFADEPMPDDVAARLETAFTGAPAPLSVVREPGDDHAVPDEADDHAVPDEIAPKRAARSSRRLRWATPIAIAAGAVAFVGFGLDYLSGRDSAQSDKAASSAAGEADSQARTDAGGQAPAVAGQEPNSSALKSGTKLEVPAGPQILSSGVDYTAKTLADPPAQAMAGSTVPRATAGSDPLKRLRTAAALQDCLDMIAAANGGGHLEAETVDFAKYRGKPAIVVRFTTPDGKVWAMASGPACGTLSGGADTLAKVPVR